MQALGNDAGILLGTSLGLLRPMPFILSDIQAALDPNGTTLTQWNMATTNQPCAQYSGQPSGRYGVGAGVPWIACVDAYVAPSATRSPVMGGGFNIQAAAQTPKLSGTLPLQLQELRTATFIYLQVRMRDVAHVSPQSLHQ